MAELKDLNTLRRFAMEKMQKVGLFETPRLFCDLYCLEPGQAQKAHSHGEADKVYLVVEGRAQIQVGSERFDVGPQQAVLAPSGSDHGVVNPGPGRAVLYVLMAHTPAGGGSTAKPAHDHDHGH
ncbi:MAG: cupin domain-containing protein [Nitrospirae bacterium]|nr:cupin domain-containing protein [Nitrospirota bacterium]